MRPARLVLLLALLLPLVAEARPDGRTSHGTDDASVLSRADLTPCDARVLAAHWNTDPPNATAALADKIRRGDQATLRSVLGEARARAWETGANCDFSHTGLGSNDAELLAGAWGIDVYEAKARLASKVMLNGLPWVRDEVLTPLQVDAHEGPEVDGADADAAAYFQSDAFTYCDATILARGWGTSPWEAKTALGFKLRNGYAAQARQAVDDQRARAIASGHTCPYQESGYSYDDAVALAAQWGMGVPQAKVKLEQRLLQGTALAARRPGGTAEPQAPVGGDDLSAFFSSDYTLCDARFLAGAWGIGLPDAKAAIGYKVRNDLRGMLTDALGYARGRQPQLTCAFLDEFTANDAQVLARAWGVGVSEAKARASRKLTAGDGAAIKRQLRR